MVKPMEGQGAAVVFTEREHLSDQSQTAVQGSRHTLPKCVLDKGPVRKRTPIYHLTGGVLLEPAHGRDVQERTGNGVTGRHCYLKPGVSESLLGTVVILAFTDWL